MKSENIIGFRHFPFNLYENPLPSKRYREFLDNPDYAGKDKHSIPNELEDRLEQGMRIVYHIIHDFDRIERSKAYEVINAKSMHNFLDAIIQYEDFRTSELVRLLFEASIIFLKNSKQFESQKEIIEDMAKPLSKFFQMLSHSLLQDEVLDKNLTKDEQEKIKNYLQRHDRKIEYNESKMLEEQNKKLIAELNEMDVYDRIISKQIKITDPSDPMLPIWHDPKEIIEQIRKNKERIIELHGESFIREGQIWRLSNAYNHLESYMCRIKPLEEFQYMLDRIDLDGSYIKNVDEEFKHLKTREEFSDMMYEKYKNKKGGKNTKSIIIPGKEGSGAAQIPKDVYNTEMKKFFREKGVDLEYGNREKQEIKAKKSIKYWKYHPKWIVNDPK